MINIPTKVDYISGEVQDVNILSASEINSIVSEIKNTIINSGGELSSEDSEQLYKAILAIIDVKLANNTTMMLKSTYDSDDDGVVDNAATVNGHTVEKDVPSNAVFTDTQVELVDLLTSSDTNKALTANQGKVLKGLIDNINTLLASDDTTLNELQEIVDYIKQNKTDLESLGISNITGLQTALDGKEDAFTKNTAFNKNFGTGADEVSVGNHNHDLEYEPLNAHIVKDNENNTFTKSQNGNIEVLTYAANVTVDLSLSNRYSLTVTGDCQIDNPTSLVNGQGGLIYITQDATGGRVVTWDTNYVFVNTPSEDTAADKVNMYAYETFNNKVVIQHIGAF